MPTKSNQLPETGFLRLPQIIGDKKNNIPALIPVSRSTFLKRVKDELYPQPIRLGQRSVAWLVDDIRILIKQIGTKL